MWLGFGVDFSFDKDESGEGPKGSNYGVGYAFLECWVWELELGEYLVFACHECAHLLFGLMSARGEDG